MARDRTNEFMATIKSMAGKPQFLANGTLPELRARNKVASQNGSTVRSSPYSNPSSSQYSQFSRFMGGSRQIAHDLALTYQKLEKINLLAQKKTIFDDEESSRELNELIYIVKQDITSLNKQIETLRQVQSDQIQSVSGSGSGGSQNVKSHTKNVVTTLQQQLAKISSSFKSTLELRSKNMKKQKQRREQFTNAPTVNTPFLSAQPAGQSRTPSLQHSRSASTLEPANARPNNANTVIDFGDNGSSSSSGDGGNNFGPRHRHTNSLQTQTLLQFQDNSNEYLEERANTMQTIESTISELGTIFNQLATMVQQQDEMIIRIDANVNDTLLNVEAAHQSLLQYLTSVTSNRWLMIKVFAVLFAFFLIFVLFAA